MWNEGVTDLHIYILSILQDNFRFVGVTKVVKNKKRNQYGLGNFEEIYLFIYLLYLYLLFLLYIYMYVYFLTTGEVWGFIDVSFFCIACINMVHFKD